MKSHWLVLTAVVVCGTLAARQIPTPGDAGFSASVGASVPVPRIATTTSCTSITAEPLFNQQTGAVSGFRPTGSASLVANADVNGDDVNDLILVTVDPPSAPPGGTGEYPARYRVFVTDGATGATLHNLDVLSPSWW